MDVPDGIRLALQEAETVTVPDRGKWRVGYLGVHLEQRMEWHYKGVEAEEERVQELIESLVVN